MKKPIAILFFAMFLITAFGQVDSLKNASLIGQASRNQKVGQGFQIGFVGSSDDTCQINTKLQIVPNAGSGKVLTSDANGFGTWTAPPFWKLTGNAGTNPNTNFIGTTDAQNLRVGTNGFTPLIIDSLGRVNIYNQSWLDSFIDLLDYKYNYNVITYDTVRNLLTSTQQNADIITASIFDFNNNNNTGWNTYLDTSNQELAAFSYYKSNSNNITYQVGAWHQPQFSDSDYTEISAFNRNMGLDIGKFRLYVDSNLDGNMWFHLDDTNDVHRNIHYYNTQILPDSGLWYLGTPAYHWKATYTDALNIEPNAALGKVLTSDASGNATWQNRIESGTFTNLTTYLDTNITSATACNGQWSRLDSLVTFSFRITIQATVNGVYQVSVALPYNSNFTDDWDCIGVGSSAEHNENGLYVHADTVNDRISIHGNDNDTSPHYHYITGSYVVK